MPDSTWKAFYWIFISSLFFSVMGVAVKFLSSDFSSNTLVFYRAFFNFILFLPLFLSPNFRIIKKGSRVLVFRGFFGFLGVSFHYYALKSLPLGVAYLIGYTAPLFVIVFSFIFLKESLSRGALFFIFVVFCGFFFISLPALSFTEGEVYYSLLSIIVAILGAVFAAAAYTAVRAAGQSFRPEMIVFYLCLVSTGLSLPYFLWQWEIPQNKEQVFLIFIMGISATFAQYALTKGYQFAKAGPVSVMSGMSALFSLLWGYLFFREILFFDQLIGGVLIFFGVSGLSLYKKH